MWLRALAVAVVLVVWVVVRKSMRLPIAHPWLLAITLAGASALVSDRSDRQPDLASAHALFTLAALLGFGCILALGEGLRREVGIAPAGVRRLAGAVALCAAASTLCALLPAPRDRIVADIAGAAILLNLLGPLSAARQRVGSWLLGAGIIAYALVRTVLVVVRLRGGDVIALEHVLDSGVIALLGAGIVAFVLEGALRKAPPR